MGGGPLPDVLPVHGEKESELLEITEGLDPVLHGVTHLLDRPLGVLGYWDFCRKLESSSPVHDLVVSFLRRL